MFLHISLLSDDFSSLRTEALLASQPLDRAEFSGPTGRVSRENVLWIKISLMKTKKLT